MSTSAQNKTLLELSDLYGVTEKTVRRWKKDHHINVQDEEEVKRFRATLQGNNVAGGLDLKEQKIRAEIRLKEAQAEKAETLLEETKGNLISLPELEEALFAIGSKIKSQLSRLEKQLPPRLEGLSGSDMIPIVREEVETILAYLSEELLTSGLLARDAREN